MLTFGCTIKASLRKYLRVISGHYGMWGTKVLDREKLCSQVFYAHLWIGLQIIEGLFRSTKHSWNAKTQLGLVALETKLISYR